MNHLNDKGVQNVYKLEKPLDKNHVLKTTGVWKKRKRRNPGNKASFWNRDCTVSELN